MPRRAAKPPPAPLSRERIVEAALAHLDRVGLAGFSLREVARDLEVYPTALYWHVGGGRDALLAAAAGAALADVRPPEAEDWRAWFRDLFARYRAAIRRHPGVAPLLAGQLLSNAGVDVGLVEAMLARLAGAGFEGEALRHAYNTAVAAMIGFASLELAAPPPEGTQALRRMMEERLDALDPARHPVLAANLPALRNRAFILRWEDGRSAPLDDSFATFAKAVVAGLDALPRRRS